MLNQRWNHFPCGIVNTTSGGNWSEVYYYWWSYSSADTWSTNNQMSISAISHNSPGFWLESIMGPSLNTTLLHLEGYALIYTHFGLSTFFIVLSQVWWTGDHEHFSAVIFEQFLLQTYICRCSWWEVHAGRPWPDPAAHPPSAGTGCTPGNPTWNMVSPTYNI